MFECTDKRRIYWLIDQYLNHKISAWDFCKEYHACYDTEVDLNTLNEKECSAFSELSMVAGRFSDSEEDHTSYPGVYYSEEELCNKLLQVKNILKGYWPRLI